MPKPINNERIKPKAKPAPTRMEDQAMTPNTDKNDNDDFDKAAEDLRLAIKHLSIIVGKVDVEEILDSIFNDFCIGK